MRIYEVLVIIAALLFLQVFVDVKGGHGSHKKLSSHTSSRAGGWAPSEHRQRKVGADDAGDFSFTLPKHIPGNGINKKLGGYSSRYGSSSGIANEAGWGSSTGGSSVGGSCWDEWWKPLTIVAPVAVVLLVIYVFLCRGQPGTDD